MAVFSIVESSTGSQMKKKSEMEQSCHLSFKGFPPPKISVYNGLMDYYNHYSKDRRVMNYQKTTNSELNTPTIDHDTSGHSRTC